MGAAGQLGSDLVRAWVVERPGDEVVALGHQDVEITSPYSVREIMALVRPTLVVNATAYNLVDQAEADPAEAFAVNAVGVQNLALACREVGVPLLHVSTDYVFDGLKAEPYVESDPVAPLGAYGVSKAAGEMLVRAALPARHWIVRTCGLYGVAGSRGKGGNFVETMLRLAGEGREIRMVADQLVTPTHTADLARQLVRLASGGPFGTFHATCQGRCTWYEFAAEIFCQGGVEADLKPQSQAQNGRPARRPANSVLDNRRLREAGLDLMPDWRESLASYLARRRA
ncbi:MAG: dTDP-4-dehydrorhamnose reductase [Candidatus Dormibacteraeota bacterium]|nr:dTDP-4-dehydrorhamnose reductase [Candidatus Dormibacteraeota bacterium]